MRTPTNGLSVPALIWLLLLGPATGLVRAQEPDGPSLLLSLEDAIELALENNLDLRIQIENRDIARYEYLGSWGAFDPTLGFTGSYEDTEIEAPSSLSGADVVTEDTISAGASLVTPFITGGDLRLAFNRRNTDTNNQFSLEDTSTSDTLSATFTQPLLRGAWRRYATLDQQEADLRLAVEQERVRQTREELVFNVVNAYWDLVSSLAQLEVREQAVELGLEQLEQNRSRLRVGIGTEVDVLQAETNVATQEEQRLLAETSVLAAADAVRALIFLRTNEEELERYMERWDMPIRPLTPLPDVQFGEDALVPDWDRSLVMALEHRSELIRQRFEVASAEVGLQRARSNRLPQLDLDLTASSSAFDAESSEALSDALAFEFPTFTAGLTYSMSLRNRAARYAERSARSAIRLARLTYDQIEMNIVSEIRAATRDVVYQTEAVEAAVRSVELAERQLAAEEARYREGLSTTFQVLEFQQTLSEARSSEQAARVGFAKSLASLRKAEGRISEPPGEEVAAGR